MPTPDDLPVSADWPVPAGVPALLFGGSFDPPHVAHATLALRARDRALCEDAWLVLVPAARSPHKATGPAASDADRLDMLRAAFAGAERVEIWTDELARGESGEPSYWVDTLERARRAHAGELRFLIGADQAVAFGRWREPGRILELAEPVVLLRPPISTPDLLAGALREAGEAPDAWLARVADVGTLPESSTDVRAGLEAGACDEAAAHLAPGVLAIIRERGLYR